MADQRFHTASSHAEEAAVALGSVYAANEVWKAIEEDHKGADEHYLKAAVGAAVAIGAFSQLQKKSHHNSHHSGAHGGKGSPNPGEQSSPDNHNSPSSFEPPGHHRRLLEEAIGAYGLGKEILGDRRHHVAHLIEEAIGAVGLVKELQAKGHKSG